MNIKSFLRMHLGVSEFQFQSNFHIFFSKLSIQADSKDDIVTKKSSHTSNYMHFYSKWLINIQRLGAMVFFVLHWSLSEMFNFIFM